MHFCSKFLEDQEFLISCFDYCFWTPNLKQQFGTRIYADPTLRLNFIHLVVQNILQLLEGAFQTHLYLFIYLSFDSSLLTSEAQTKSFGSACAFGSLSQSLPDRFIICLCLASFCSSFKPQLKCYMFCGFLDFINLIRQTIVFP